MRSNFNHAVSVFLPEGTDPEDGAQPGAGLTRTPACTRPLALNSTGPTAISSATSRKLSRAVAVAVAGSQKGLIRKLNSLNHVVEFDAWARIASMRPFDPEGCP